MAITKPKKGGKGPPKMPASTKMPGPPPEPTAKEPARSFAAKKWDDGDGETIIIYGDTGIGKTSLARLAPRPVFIGLDDGGKKLRNPDGTKLDVVSEVKTYSDVRSALQQQSVYVDYDTVVIDTVTFLQDMAEVYVVENIRTDRGEKVKNLLGYGYNKGYKHLYNTMKLILQDCEVIARTGKNIILIAQGINNNVPNPGGEDFLRHGPRLHIDKSWSIEALYCEWVSHILRISYFDNEVSKDKKITGSTTRAVFIQPEPHFRAKSRTVNEPVVAFADDTDSSVWDFIFAGRE